MMAPFSALCEQIEYKLVHFNSHSYDVPVKLKLQHPPPLQATLGAFELFKIGFFKFPPLGAKRLFKCPTNYSGTSI